eukprot:GHUV01001741.1.p1 GENE.GHUV01001741.1~~GHUV01001741.1.p1  ORF type:complete len:139 (+),score=30.61 GHUV01001741.1:110-526(+)
MSLVQRLVKRVEDFELPKASTVCFLVLVSYFLVTAGIAYDIINEPPAIGATQDEVTGKIKPQPFMPSRMNGQYIMEGITGAMMYSLGGLSLIALDQVHNKRVELKYRKILVGMGIVGLVVSYFAVLAFFNIKMPGYWR